MTDDETAIRVTIEAYVAGFNRGSKDLLRQALHPRFISSGFIDGTLQWDTVEQFADFCASAAPDPHGPVPALDIEMLVVSGPTAVAVVRDRWGNREFRDILTLLKDQDGWRIAFKAFHGLK